MNDFSNEKKNAYRECSSIAIIALIVICCMNKYNNIVPNRRKYFNRTEMKSFTTQIKNKNYRREKLYT